MQWPRGTSIGAASSTSHEIVLLDQHVWTLSMPGSEHELLCVVRGYHTYKDVWYPHRSLDRLLTTLYGFEWTAVGMPSRQLTLSWQMGLVDIVCTLHMYKFNINLCEVQINNILLLYYFGAT